MVFDPRKRSRVGETSTAVELTLQSMNKRQKPMGLERKQHHLCSAVLDRLMSHSYAADTVLRMEASEHVWRRMDLSTVKSKLERDNYSTVDAFAADVRLSFSNALHYHDVGAYEKRAKAKVLSQVFENKLFNKLRISPAASKKNPLEECNQLKVRSSNGVADHENHQKRRRPVTTSTPAKRIISNQEKGYSTSVVVRTEEQKEEARRQILAIERTVFFEDALEVQKELKKLLGYTDMRVKVWTLDKLGLVMKKDDGHEFEQELEDDQDLEEGEIRC